MKTDVGVPVTITPEAEAHIATLGIQSPLEQMLDFAAKNFPGVLRIAVTLQPPCETDPEPHLMIEPYLPERGPDDLANWYRWSKWEIAHFPGREVGSHVTLWQRYESENGR